MLNRVALCALLAACWLDQAPARAQAPAGTEVVEFQSGGQRGALIKGYLRRPTGVAKAPLVVALHGCGGLLNRRGEMGERERDWAARFVAAGYAVLHPDSFNPRGFREICTLKLGVRNVRPRDRAEDAAAAIAWAASQPFIDAERIAVIGWSHGGSSTLWTADQGNAAAPRLKAAIAFYPGCRVPLETASWAPGAPLTILMGDADDWTPPAPCRDLVAKHPTIRYVEYPGAVHGFDAPNAPVRTRTDVGSTRDGTAKVGTDPKARAAAITEVMQVLVAAFKQER
ncbi:MAG: dienelactone hydrolase family protein [Hyphomicrobiaceae bacterium]